MTTITLPEKSVPHNKQLILASNSPRRRQILSMGGWDYSILAEEIDEDPLPGEDPRSYVRRLAEEKARAASAKAPSGSILIGADTTVVCTGPEGIEEILGKPASPQEAAEMLVKLRESSHYVYTAVSVFEKDSGDMHSEVCATEVSMRPYTDEEIKFYVDSGDPMDKAGAYAIQDKDFHPVESIRGCFPNVVGLPLCRLSRLLAEVGLPIQTKVTAECQTDAHTPCRVYRQVLVDEKH